MWTKPTTAIENAGAGGEAQETQGVIDNVVAGVIDNAVAGVIDNAVAGVIDNAVGKVDEGVKSRETYRQIVCQTAGGAETTIEAVSEASGRRSQIILGADAEQADKAVELVDPEEVKSITKSFVELPEVPEQLSKLYPKLAGEEAKIYLRLTPKNLMRLLPKKLIKLSN